MKMERVRSSLLSFSAHSRNNEEVHRKSGLMEIQKQQQIPITALQSSLGEQHSALQTLQTEVQQQVLDEEGHRKSLSSDIQQQLRRLEEQHQKPITTLQNSLAEQRSSLETLQAELHKLSGVDGNSKSGMAEVQQKLEAYRSMVAKVSQEVSTRLHDLEIHHEKVRELDLDVLQTELKSQQEQLRLAATLCRTAETAAERLVAAVLIGSAFLGCSNILALARPMGLYTVAVPLLAAGAGLRCGQAGYSLQHAIDVLPQSWQLRVRDCWTRVTNEIQQRGLKPLTRASQEIGLDKHARSCLSAVTDRAGKLRKRLAAEDENNAPSNVEVEAPSPKRARMS